MKLTFKLISIFILIILNISELRSQTDDTVNIDKAIDEIFHDYYQGRLDSTAPFISDNISFGDLDSITKNKQLEALRAYFDYRSIGFKHRQEVFDWQLFSTKVIFVVVILLVIAGIYFSGVQFHNSLKAQKSLETKEEITELEASLKGIKISSPILGVIILTISFLFFYLYLIHVYPIQEIF